MTSPTARSVSRLAAVLLVVSVSGVSGGEAEPVYPAVDWAPASPREAGMDEDLLDAVGKLAGGAGCVVRGGRLVASWGSREVLWDLKSTTKSIGVTALGLAIADGLVRLDAAAETYHPGFGVPPATNGDLGWVPDITIRHLATHSAGFEKGGGFSALGFAPGTCFAYSDGGANWLADCLTFVFAADLRTVLLDRLFEPIGISGSEVRWRSNAYRPTTINGVVRREIGSGLRLSVDAMARIGYLYLRRGRWRGEQILSPGFVDRVATPDAAIVGLDCRGIDAELRSGDHYGLLWWNNGDGTIEDLPRDAYWSWGLYESLIVVIPSLDLVVSRAGGAWQDGWVPDYSVLAPFLSLVARSVRAERPRFNRGDVDDDGILGVTDAVTLLVRLFGRGQSLQCVEAADGNNDGFVDISDAIAILLYHFLGGAVLAEPGPPGSPCGEDTDAPGSSGDLGCLRHDSC